MAAPRQIVVPNAPVRGAVAAAACVGMLHGLAIVLSASRFFALYMQPGLLSPIGSLVVWGLIAPLCLIAPAWCTARSMARLTQQPSTFVLGGTAYAAAFVCVVVAMWFVQTFESLPRYAFDATRMVMLQVIWWAVITVPVALLAMGLFSLIRWTTARFRYTLMPQSGSLCWKCAYDLGSALVTVCPECGTAADPRRFRQAWLVCGIRKHLPKARLLLVALFAALALFVGASYVRHVSSTVRLVNQLKASSHATDAVSYSHLQMTSDSALHAADLAVSTDSGDLPASGVVVGITLWRAPDGGSPLTATLQLMVRVPPPYRPSPLAMVEPGSARVIARLDAAQTEAIARTGVPASLKKALVDEAARVGWTPTPLPPGTFVPVQPLPVHEVDPDPHFPSPP